MIGRRRWITDSTMDRDKFHITEPDETAFAGKGFYWTSQRFLICGLIF